MFYIEAKHQSCFLCQLFDQEFVLQTIIIKSYFFQKHNFGLASSFLLDTPSI